VPYELASCNDDVYGTIVVHVVVVAGTVVVEDSVVPVVDALHPNSIFDTNYDVLHARVPTVQLSFYCYNFGVDVVVAALLP
jgi:hypothetical protein